MALAKVTLTCSCCGKTFVHSRKVYNRRDADNYEEWAAAHIDTCPQCYAAAQRELKQKATAKKLESVTDKLAPIFAKHPLPEITGVSDKQIAFAQRLRDHLLGEYPEVIEDYFHLTELTLDSPDLDRDYIKKMAEDSGDNEEACLAKAINDTVAANLLYRQIAAIFRFGEARKIIDTLK